MKALLRVAGWASPPVFFSAGWAFNYFIDIRFVAGFAAGWMSHSWLGGIIDAVF